MTAFFLGVWMAISSFFGFSHVEQEEITLPISEMTVPTGNPGQSAPDEAVNACNGKQSAETCSFTLNTSELTGMCEISGEELACTPLMPNP